MKTYRNFIGLAGINQKSWLNPLFSGLIPAIILILIQPVRFDPYLFNALETSDFIVWFEDLNQNGKKERFQLNANMAGDASIYFYNENGELIDQQNFTSQMALPFAKRKPYAVDFDKDGVKELIIFSQKKDSIYINVFNYAKNRIETDNKFVTIIGGINEKTDYYLNWIGHHDVNNDKVPEFYFSITGGFALYPRRIFRYDFQNDSIIASINTGAGNLYGTLFIQNDSIAVIASGAAYGNTRNNYPYPFHDTTSWLFNFDKDLQLRNTPKSYGGYPGYIGQIFQADSFVYFVYAANNSLNQKSKLIKMNWQGEEVDSVLFDNKVGSTIFNIDINGEKKHYFTRTSNNNYIFINTDDFGVYTVDKLNLRKKIDLVGEQDLNDNHKPEYFFYDHQKRELVLFDENLRNPCVIAEEAPIRFLTANFYSHLGYGELIVNTDKHSKIYQYRRNPNRNLKYPLWISIYLLSVLFVSFILYFQKRRINKQQELEQQLANLQLQNLRNQLDPHFTFSVLNTIGNYIYKQDKEKAYDLFQRFTRIIRFSLMVSDKVFWSLKEEMQFTKDYLEFQKLRFKERFEFTINIDNNIEPDKIQFPKMLVQGFAENAVKHAFYGIHYTGQISIHVSREKASLTVVIEDDGIGINKSRELQKTSGTQKGLNILQEQVKQINRLYHTNFKIEIEDKQVYMQPGTRVTVRESLSKDTSN